MILKLIAICLNFFFVISANAELEPEAVQLFSKSIVRTIVDGTVSSDKNCSLRGTGFFIDKLGHILTAAHNVLPCSEGNLGPRLQWKSYPNIQIEMYNPNSEPGKPTLEKVQAVIIYAEEQTDLALLRANVINTQPLPLAPHRTLKAGMNLSIMTFEIGQAQPSDKPIKVESLFNPSEQHNGLIDISGPDIKQSASGSPMFDKSAYVAGVFTKGSRDTGEAVVPIAFAASLFSMCGVSYPSEDVREVIEELRRDIIHQSLELDKFSGNVTWHYKKRLKAGSSPSLFTAVFSVYTSKGKSGTEEFGLDVKDSVIASPCKSKNCLVIFQNISFKIDDWIEKHNQHAALDPANVEKLGKKTSAKVTIEAEFADEQKINVIRDFPMRF